MKFITAIAALALLTGSIDVEAQQRKNLNKKSGRSEKPEAHQIAREVAETGSPHISPVAHLAIGVFGELDPEERNDLAEAAGEGDEEALEELQLDQLAAIETLVDALEDDDMRQLILIGMYLGPIGHDGLVEGGTGLKSAKRGKGSSLQQAGGEKFVASGGNPADGDAFADTHGAPAQWSESDIEFNRLLDRVQEQLTEELERMEEGITSKMEAN